MLSALVEPLHLGLSACKVDQIYQTEVALSSATAKELRHHKEDTGLTDRLYKLSQHPLVRGKPGDSCLYACTPDMPYWALHMQKRHALPQQAALLSWAAVSCLAATCCQKHPRRC